MKPTFIGTHNKATSTNPQWYEANLLVHITELPVPIHNGMKLILIGQVRNALLCYK